MTNEQPIIPAREMDIESLKALAHPLRVRIVDALATYGAFTASGLAERLGESSGATSYHLRQLEKHRFVREVEGRGTARERWWERVPGAIELRPPSAVDSAASKSAARLLLNEFSQTREQKLRDFESLGAELVGTEWASAASVSVASVNLTLDQLTELSAELDAFIDRATSRYRGQRVPGARPVQLHVAAFPVVDGAIITSEDLP